MGDTSKPGIDKLPGNHGQFGADVETENYETLPDLDATDPGTSQPGSQDVEAPVDQATVPAPDEADDGAKTPGQHQEQGGMRS